MENQEFKFNYNCKEALKKNSAEIKSTKLIQKSMISSHKQYEIIIKKSLNILENNKITINRRYSDFAFIHKKIKKENPSFILPALPEKYYLNLINLSSEEQEDLRKEELEIYINKILSIENWDKIREFKELFSSVF